MAVDPLGASSRTEGAGWGRGSTVQVCWGCCTAELTFLSGAPGAPFPWPNQTLFHPALSEPLFPWLSAVEARGEQFP